MSKITHRIRQFSKYLASADTFYRVHSPAIFELAKAVLEDERFFYAFRDVEDVRYEMLRSEAILEVIDFGAGAAGSHELEGGVRVHTRTAPLSKIVRLAGSSPRQSRRLFRLVHHFQPKKMLELGTSVGIGAMYMACAARDAEFKTLEGCESCAGVAKVNLDILQLKNVEVVVGAFENSLVPSLEKLGSVDLVFFDGNHRREPTVHYFDVCLRYAHPRSVFVFDDIYWSEGMTEAWQAIKAHPQVTTTVDFFDFGVAFFNPDFREKQHFQLVPSEYKIWQKFI